MKFDLPTLRGRIGLVAGDVSKDVDLQLGLDLVTQVLETYLDRKLDKSLVTEIQTHFAGNVASLKRYPIITITSVDNTGVPETTPYHVGYDTGLLMFDGHVIAHELKVTYTGGFDPWPDDLVLAALLVFDAVWPSVEGGGSVAVAAGTIEKVVLQDVGSVSYATGAAAASLGDTGLIPGSAASILSKYARQVA